MGQVRVAVDPLLRARQVGVLADGVADVRLLRAGPDVSEAG